VAKPLTLCASHPPQKQVQKRTVPLPNYSSFVKLTQLFKLRKNSITEQHCHAIIARELDLTCLIFGRGGQRMLEIENQGRASRRIEI
jgi:hypothetical protein